MLVRERRPSDEPELLEIARLVHVQDGCPVYLPDVDFRQFLFGHETLGAWIAEDDLGVAGHVALHPRSSRAVMELAAQVLAQPADRLGVVARLLVHPNRRRVGAGAALLRQAAQEAAGLGLWPILDVVEELAEAVSLYERCGWMRIGGVPVTFRGGLTVQEFVYVAPPTLRPD